ncbi:MAG: hypothetical protein OHK0012_00850 [Synechococcales cyanobacterium]
MKETLVLHDQDRSLECEILRQFTLEGTDYALVVPVLHPIQILCWEEDEEDEERDALVDPEPEELEAALPIAQSVLEELNLKLCYSAYVLTVHGEIPDAEEDDILEITNEDDAVEEYQLLATFFHEEIQYGVFALLDPLLLFVVLPAEGDPHLLSPDTPAALLDRLQEELVEQLAELSEGES